MYRINKNKYEKYKNKYILLKQKIQEGGNLKYIGAGASGCLICPPIKPIEIKPDNQTNYNSDLSFDEINDCKYVGKILAIRSNAERDLDSYENELRQLKIIKDLDENGVYTPKLIYANIHTKVELLNILKKDVNVDVDAYLISECVNDKIKEMPYYGYIVSKHTGISLDQKYNYNVPDTDVRKLNKFLEKFNELLKFIKILYDKNFLHLDIKIDNITIKEEEDDKLYLIDFGRTLKLIKETDFDKIINSFLRQQHYMYSFEPKIFYNLLKYYTEKKINEISFQELIQHITSSFKILRYPYDYTSPYIYEILKKVFDSDIFKYQKEYLIQYIHDCEYKYINTPKNKKQFFNDNKNDFLKDNFPDLKLNESNKDNIWEEWNSNKDEFWKKYEDEIWEKYEDIFFDNYMTRFLMKHSKDKLNIKELLNYIFYPLIEKYDMYCMGIVLAEIVFFKYNFDDLNKQFKTNFKNLIKSLLFNKFNKVDEIMTEITELTELLKTNELSDL